MRIPSSHIRRLLIFSFAFTTYIKAGAQLHADFTSNTQQGCAPLIVQFKDVSTGNPTEWVWDLGNGATSTDTIPSAFYFNPGSYTVKLHIKNATGEDSVIKSNYITVYNKPSIAFTASPSEGCAPLNVQFTDLSKAGSGNILSWIWDFGDGMISTSQNPLHTYYNVLDTFNVLLTVTNSFGCKNTLTEPSLIKIKGVVIADFSYKYNNACKAPDTVKFTNASQSTQFLTYQWSFGDGTPVSTLKNPDHIYATTGNFTVKLTVTNASGCSDTYSQAISIGSTITDFTFTNPCLNAPAIFTDSSTPKPLYEIWDFGDGTTDSGYQVSHTYTTGSSYNVTLTADFGGCINTKTKTIQIDKKPVVDFNATTNRNTCMVPDTVQFFGSLQNVTAFKWFLGDGTTSTDINPTHIYKVAGKFTVSLIAYNANGCSDTVIKENFIQIGPPQIEGVANLPFGGCAPQTFKFNPIIDFDSTITSYSWDFGDGSTSTNAIPVHQYKQTGIYNITLMVSSVEGCKDSLFIPGAVTLGKAPTALFDAWPVDVCGKKPVKFKDTSSGIPTSWLWLYGDGTSSTAQNPTHTYVDTGYFDVTLIASQYGCNDTLVKIGYIHVTPPVAKFGYTSYCKNLYTYYFSDSSISPKTWYWDFGDGSTSTSQNPQHTYSSKGIFVVSLTVTNNGCSYKKSDTLNIIRENPSIQYEFLSPNSCEHDSIRFSAVNYDTANIKSLKWDFGDSTSAYQNWNENFIYHLYNDAGTYSPLLIIKDINNCMDTIDTHTQVQALGPKAAFSNVSGDCLLSAIKFNDESSSDGIDAITTWIWDFGDGTPPDTLAAPPFEHTYISTGTFNVSLKVIDKNNCYDTITNMQNLSISRPVADFIATDTISCSQSPVQFLDSSKGAISLTYKWNFGDGLYSFNSNPTHSFNHEGLYDVKLIIKDQFNCTDSIIKPRYIRVVDPEAAFILTDSLFLCPPAKISPVNTSVNYSSLLWDFGDGNTSSATMPEHYYSAVGLYTLSLIATGYGHCSDTFTKSLVLKGPLAQLNYSPLTGCAPLHVSFTAKSVNTIKYLWDFGNGVLHTTSLPGTNYTYTIPGDFLPQLVIIDSSGCRVPVVIPDTIVVAGAKANYLVSTKEGICDSSLYNFTDSSVVSFDKILSYNWQFGDGESSSEINPYHYYTRGGLYNTSVNINTENGCVATYQVPVNVLIDSTPRVFATFPDSACINAPVSLSAGVTNNLPWKCSWLWSLGNGDSSYTNNAMYSYSTPGTYNLYVVGTSAAGCSDTVFHTTRIGPLPFTDAGSDTVICRGESAHLTATGADIYTWSQAASLSCTSCSDPVATPLRNTTYFLTGANSFGCKAIDSVNIQVKHPIHVSISAPNSVCMGSSIQLKATGAELYNWEPASQVTNSTDSITSSTPSSTTKYSVIGTDSLGCFSDTASLTVKVFPLPTVQLPDSITINAGSSYQVEAKGSPDVISWNWSPLQGLSCSACANPLITPPANETYIVEVKNITGCTAESHISFTVTCKGQNLFIPNTFSPNADGMNDYFYPRGKGIMNVQLFRVFSRWGTVVYERTNFPPNQQSYGWDGTYNGKALPADVYVFIAEVACENGVIISLKGNVTLLR